MFHPGEPLLNWLQFVNLKVSIKSFTILYNKGYSSVKHTVILTDLYAKITNDASYYTCIAATYVTRPAKIAHKIWSYFWTSTFFWSTSAITMKSLCLIHKSIIKQTKFTEHEYHKYRPRKVLFSEHVYSVQMCPVFAGPVTYYSTYTYTIL